MNFEEWYAKDEEDFYNFEKESARACWNAAIDEAGKVCYDSDKSTHPSDLADKIKQLKE